MSVTSHSDVIVFDYDVALLYKLAKMLHLINKSMNSDGSPTLKEKIRLTRHSCKREREREGESHWPNAQIQFVDNNNNNNNNNKLKQLILHDTKSQNALC